MPRRNPNYETMNYDARRRILDYSPTSRKRQLERIFLRDLGICQICFLPCTRADASRDHIKSIVKCSTRKEATADTNVRLAHKLCNNELVQRTKGTKPDIPTQIVESPPGQHLTYSLGDANPQLLALYQKIDE